MDEMHDRSVSGAEAVDEGRREFLQGVRRWSTAVATLALGGGFVAASAPSAAAWVNGSWINGPGGWVNRPGGWINGPGSWVNRPGGWINSPGWVNRGSSWINGPGGWVNRPGGWINGSGGGTAWVNRRGGTSWANR